MRVATLEIGRIVMKTAGREAGRYACVLKKLDDTFVLITGPKVLTGVKRRRCNVDHLEPTPHSIKIKAEASDTEVIKAYDEAGLLKKLGLRMPGPEVLKEIKKEEKKVPKKVEKPKEKPKKPKEKKGITIKLKIPSLKKPKKEKKVKEVKKKVKKKKVAKKPVKKKGVKKKKK
jgi:large subunit ribosomal protein L14e